MSKVVVTLQDRTTGAVVTVVRRNRHGAAVSLLHREILKDYPNHYIRKSIVKR